MISETKSGGPAFARPGIPRTEESAGTTEQNGMTMLAYYAGQVLAGVVAKDGIALPGDREYVADLCFDMADAMLAAGRRRGA